MDRHAKQYRLTDVIIVKSDSIVYNSRVRKIIKSLNKEYDLAVLGWNREGLGAEIIGEEPNFHFFPKRAAYGKPSFVPYVPIFWTWILIKLLHYKPHVVHACDLDTVFPCYLYKLIWRKKLVFEVIDRYAPSKIPIKHSRLYSFINFLENQFSKRADVLITVTQKVLDTFGKKPRMGAVIMNCSEDHTIEEVEKEEKGIFTLVYTGAIIKGRGLERITEAIRNEPNVQLLVAGRIIDKDLMDKISEFPNVTYKGLLHTDEALNLEASSDAMIILYDLKKPNNNFASPTKIFEAMMFGIPVITNVSSELVNEVSCGTIVDYDDLAQIREAVTNLRDNTQLRKTMGANGHRAFLRKYNWNRMERELYKVYDVLLKDLHDK